MNYTKFLYGALVFSLISSQVYSSESKADGGMKRSDSVASLSREQSGRGSLGSVDEDQKDTSDVVTTGEGSDSESLPDASSQQSEPMDVVEETPQKKKWLSMASIRSALAGVGVAAALWGGYNLYNTGGNVPLALKMMPGQIKGLVRSGLNWVKRNPVDATLSIAAVGGAASIMGTEKGRTFYRENKAAVRIAYTGILSRLVYKNAIPGSGNLLLGSHYLNDAVVAAVGASLGYGVHKVAEGLKQRHDMHEYE